jgi:predicted GNAT family N-acyltransferase
MRFNLRITDFSRDGAALAAVRRAVFIDEQGVPEALEWDEFDALSQHLLAVSADGTPIGCARLLPDGHVGRMAVLPAWRGQGVGRALLAAVERLARAQGHRQLRLSAQIQAKAFYLDAGFGCVGEEYPEAGIPHIAMLKKLD